MDTKLRLIETLKIIIGIRTIAQINRNIKITIGTQV
jgi:hypothetical protein